MKLATYRDGSRDGQLVVVSRDLQSAHFAAGITTRLQHALDDWNFVAPQLQDLYQTLNGGKARHAFAFDPHACMAPLPRAFQWAEAPAYRCRLEWLRRADDSEALHDEDAMPMRHASDDFLGPREDAVFADSHFGIDFEGGLAVVTGDVAMGCTPEQALEGVRLLVLVNGWSLHSSAPGERRSRWPNRPPAAFGPVAVTPDDLGDAWHGGRAHLRLQCSRNGNTWGSCETGPEMDRHFGALISQLCAQRRLRAGSIVGSGPVANRDVSRGCCCIADKRAIEQLENGAPSSAFLDADETVRLDIQHGNGQSVFGTIEQSVRVLQRHRADDRKRGRNTG